MYTFIVLCVAKGPPPTVAGETDLGVAERSPGERERELWAGETEVINKTEKSTSQVSVGARACVGVSRFAARENIIKPYAPLSVCLGGTAVSAGRPGSHAHRTKYMRTSSTADTRVLYKPYRFVVILVCRAGGANGENREFFFGGVGEGDIVVDKVLRRFLRRRRVDPRAAVSIYHSLGPNASRTSIFFSISSLLISYPPRSLVSPAQFFVAKPIRVALSVHISHTTPLHATRRRQSCFLKSNAIPAVCVHYFKTTMEIVVLPTTTNAHGFHVEIDVPVTSLLCGKITKAQKNLLSKSSNGSRK